MPTNLFKTCFKENVFVFYVSFRPTSKLCVFFLYEKKKHTIHATIKLFILVFAQSLDLSVN